MKIKKFALLFTIAIFAMQISFSQGYEEYGEIEGVNVLGYIQPQYEYKFLHPKLAFNKEVDESGFYFNRARVGIIGNTNTDFSYYFMMEFSPLRDMGINDAFITYRKFAPYFNISLGKLRSPFGSEFMTDCHKLKTINRSKVTNELLGSFRDFGVLLSGGTANKKIFGLKTKNIFKYYLAVIKGDGDNEPDDDNRKSYIGRLIFHPWEFITFGSSFSYSNYRPSVYYYPDIVEYKDDYIKRFGYDFKVEYANIVMKGEYLKEEVGITHKNGACCAPPCNIGLVQGYIYKEGFFASVLYKTPWNIQPIVKYGAYKNYHDNYTKYIEKNSTITFGVNYFFNEWTRLQINYLYNVEELKEIPNDVLLIQVQILIK